MSADGELIEMGAEETFAALVAQLPEATRIYADAHTAIADPARAQEAPAARARAIEAGRRLVELCRNADLLEAAAPAHALVRHLGGGRPLARGLADSLILLSGARHPDDLALLPLLAPQTARAELASGRVKSFLAGPAEDPLDGPTAALDLLDDVHDLGLA